MTKEELEARLEALKAGREQVLSNLYATDGAIQECKYWLEKLQPQPEDALISETAQVVQ